MKVIGVMTLGLAVTFLPVTVSDGFAKNKGGAVAAKASTQTSPTSNVRKQKSQVRGKQKLMDEYKL